MAESNEEVSKEQFLYPRSRYRGPFTPEHLLFNSNLQEFAQKVQYICDLETNGKLSSPEAYSQIKRLWKQLKSSKKNLLSPQDPPSPA